MRPVALAPILDAVINAMCPAAVAKGVQMTNALLTPFPLQVWGGPAHLEQIFWNLVSNAIKFTSAV